MKTNTRMLLKESQKIAGCLLGAFLYAAGINLFIVPAALYTGGVMGICQVIRTLLVEYLHLPFQGFDIAGIIYYLINIPIFVLAIIHMGRRFFTKTVITVTAMTIFLALLPTAPVVTDVMTASVVGGIISGAGVGLVLRAGSSGGGMDVVGVLVTRYKKDFSVGKINLLVNIVLYSVCLFLFDVEIVIYSLIYAAVYSVAIDKIHIQNINVEVNVITKADTRALEQEVFREMGRGITKWTSLGAYTYEQSQVLYIMLSKYEIQQLKSIIHKYDPDAFIVVNEGVSVDGNFLKKL